MAGSSSVPLSDDQQDDLVDAFNRELTPDQPPALISGAETTIIDLIDLRTSSVETSSSSDTTMTVDCSPFTMAISP
ncbi:hypothetical protein ACFX15_012800 [Malus domestica]